MAPGLVPQIAALRRRLAFLPAPARSSGEASTGQPVTVEMLVNGVWTDVTAYVMVRDDSGKIDVATGIQGGEGSQTERAQSKPTLKNQDGRFTPRNPTGPYYGAIGRNTEFRISVPDGLGGKSYRIWGENSSWEPGWDTSGQDVWVDTAIVGIMQRLAQAPAPERSVLYTALTTPLPDSVMAYWPMEDASGAISLTSALPSGSPMTWTGTPTLAAYEGFPASDSVPDTSATVFSGGVAKYSATGSTQVRFLCYIPAAGLTQGTVVCAIDQEDLGGTAFWELYYGNFAQSGHSFTLRQNMGDGSELGLELESTYDVRGKNLYVSIECQQSGGTINRAVRLYDLDTQTSYDTTDTGVAATLTRVKRVQFGPASRSAVGPYGSTGLTAVAVGHATVESAITSNTILGAHLNPIGESAGRRIQRLCGEAGIPFEWIGDLDDTVRMGAQSKANTLSLAQEACLADGGLLYETKDVLGLGYRTRVSLYNQTPALTLSYTGFNFAEIPVPVEDDRQIQNQLTVTAGGVSASYKQTDGTLGTNAIGTYGETGGLTLNLAANDTPTLLDHAAWRVHLGTVDEARYPTVTVNLAHPSITPDMRRAILALRMGDRATFTGMPAWVAPDNPDQLVLGTSETLTHFEHRITFTCAPASPYSYIGYLDDGTGHLDTDGSQLLAAITSSDTKMTVVPSTLGGTLWSTDDADGPWVLRLGGETVTATANTSAVYDNFARTVSNGWGTANTGQTWTVVGTAADYAVGAGGGTATLPATGIAHLTLVPAPTADVDLYMSVSTSALATGASLFAGPIVRAVDNNNFYMARIEFTTTAGLILTLRKRVGGTETVLATYAPADITHVAGVYYRVRLQAYGAVIRARVWDLTATSVEPTDWQVSAVDSTITTADSLGTRCFSNTGNTNVNPVISFENVDLHNVQTFTVSRSTNGVVKSHAAGEDVRLANPVPISL